MTTAVAVAEIKKFRHQFSNNPNVLDALTVLESCGGDLEGAIKVLANRFGIDSNLALNLVDQQCQKLVCENHLITVLLPGTLQLITSQLMKSHLPDILSEELALIVGIYVELGLRSYCNR